MPALFLPSAAVPLRRVAALGLCLPVLFAQPQTSPPKETAGARELFFGTLQPTGVKKTSSKSAATAKPAGNPQLALRYTILKIVGSERLKVSPATKFRSGDAVRLSVQSNSPGYLYLVHQGTSGNWDLMYPSPGAREGDNRVIVGQEYLLPPNGQLRFRGEPGVEKLFLVVSRQPQQSLDELIFQLRSRPTPEQSQPRPQGESQDVLLAQNRPIDNGVIDGLRTSHTRDLVFETVASPSTGDRTEPAVYVANTSRRPDSIVVVDISLSHR